MHIRIERTQPSGNGFTDRKAHHTAQPDRDIFQAQKNPGQHAANQGSFLTGRQRIEAFQSNIWEGLSHKLALLIRARTFAIF